MVMFLSCCSMHSSSEVSVDAAVLSDVDLLDFLTSSLRAADVASADVRCALDARGFAFGCESIVSREGELLVA